MIATAASTLGILAQAAPAGRALSGIDWSVVVLYLVLSLLIAAWFTKRAGKDTGEFFLGGRSMGWFLAGTSMVATTFAADTPLAVTELVAKNGIAGNWLWWNALFGGMLTTFFFARLWRRAHILTDVEFVELRYSGKPAAFLRGFKAIYIGLFMNCIVMAWVNLAMVSIVKVCLPSWNPYWTVAGVMALVAIYSTMSGLMGVAVTDAFQFFLAIGGCVVLSLFALHDAGGIAGLKAHLPASAFQFTPVVGGGTGGGGTVSNVLALTVPAFLAYVAVQWWASWYPGSEPGGGGYVAQRMMSARDEKNSLFATLWFYMAHFCVRPWPWILTALAAMVVLPYLTPGEMPLARGNSVQAQAYQAAFANDPAKNPAPAFQAAYREAKARFAADPHFRDAFENAVNPRGMFPKMMREHLPTGLYGLLIAAFLAAYMSTISTQLNWGTSYLINDCYKRFMDPAATEKQLVLVSRVLTLVMGVVSFLITTQLDAISGAWEFVLAISAGIGLVLIFRWFWWRLNAYSEIAAMLAPVAPYLYCRWHDIGDPVNLYYIVSFTAAVTLVVTFLTRPTERGKLHDFYRRVHPGGVGWRRIAAELPEVQGDGGFGGLFMDWALGCVLIFSTLFGMGRLIFGELLVGLGLLALGAVCAGIIWWDLGRRDWAEKGDGGVPVERSAAERQPVPARKAEEPA